MICTAVACLLIEGGDHCFDFAELSCQGEENDPSALRPQVVRLLGKPLIDTLRCLRKPLLSYQCKSRPSVTESFFISGDCLIVVPELVVRLHKETLDAFACRVYLHRASQLGPRRLKAHMLEDGSQILVSKVRINLLSAAKFTNCCRDVKAFVTTPKNFEADAADFNQVWV